MEKNEEQKYRDFKSDIISDAQNREHRKIPPEPTPLMLCNLISKIFDDCARNDDINLTNSARIIMRMLSHKDGVSQLELANAAHIKPPTVSVTMQKLELDGFVRRETDEKDLRQTRVYLTEKGKSFNDKIRQRIFDMDSIALDGFTDEESAQVVDILRRLTENMIKYQNSMND